MGDVGVETTCRFRTESDGGRDGGPGRLLDVKGHVRLRRVRLRAEEAQNAEAGGDSLTGFDGGPGRFFGVKVNPSSRRPHAALSY
jgi:hypothetical protein